MKGNKSGISLIVLVITIIVMIVLAAAVVITLDNSGIINKANDAVDESNLKQVQHLASLIWADAYLDEDMKKEDITEAYIRQELADQGINTDKYDITVEENGVIVKIDTSNIPEEWKASVRELTEDGVPIPIGFVKSPYAGEGTKNGGLVIYALTETEISNGVTEIPSTETHQQSLENRNQFVWIPVDKNNFKDEFVRDDFGKMLTWKYDEETGEEVEVQIEPSNKLGKGWWEIVLDENNKPSETQNTNINYISEATLDEATDMYNSVAEYGGFYIARYEVGKDDAGNISITMGKYPYNNVAWGESLVEGADDNGAVSLSRGFYPKDNNIYGVVSTLTYGVQWDTTLNWWKGIDLTHSREYGNYDDVSIAKDDYNENAKYSKTFGPWNNAIANEDTVPEDLWLLTTGALKRANIYNIYDMAGNLNEWTMEGSDDNYLEGRVMRGGNFYCYGDGFQSVTYRVNTEATANTMDGTGFRPSLYIK